MICAQHAWLSPLPPEGASAILHRTTERAPEMAAAQGVRSLDLLRAGIVDRVVAEHPDAADEPAAYLERVAQVLEFELTALLAPRPGDPPPLAARLRPATAATSGDLTLTRAPLECRRMRVADRSRWERHDRARRQRHAGRPGPRRVARRWSTSPT